VTPVAIPDLDIARVLRWCAARVPEHARHQVRVECQVAPRHLTIVERRAPWPEDYGPDWRTFPIGRLRYTTAGNSWTLYWRDCNQRFHLYDLLTPSSRVDDLLTETDRDPPASSGDNPDQRRPQRAISFPRAGGASDRVTPGATRIGNVGAQARGMPLVPPKRPIVPPATTAEAVPLRHRAW